MALNIQERRTAGVDLRERGVDGKGRTIYLDARLYMQLHVFSGCRDMDTIMQCCIDYDVRGALYVSLHDAYGFGLLAISQDAAYFVTELRELLGLEPFASLTSDPGQTLFGRTYAIGYEQDLQEVLIRRPQRYIANAHWPWTMWYPLRRTGAFEELTAQERRTVLMEHGGVGHAYGKADHAHDIRLACHGLDTHDNDFVVGLLGKELHALSAIVQRMRQTRQTARYLSQMGPFFVGRVHWQSGYVG